MLTFLLQSAFGLGLLLSAWIFDKAAPHLWESLKGKLFYTLDMSALVAALKELGRCVLPL